MEVFIMQHIFSFIYLVVVNDGVYVYKNEEFKFHLPFLSFQPKHIFIDKSKVCELTQFS